MLFVQVYFNLLLPIVLKGGLFTCFSRVANCLGFVKKVQKSVELPTCWVLIKLSPNYFRLNSDVFYNKIQIIIAFYISFNFIYLY